MDTESIIKAGKIAGEVKAWIKPQIKKGDKLLDIADKIENKIIELGGFPAFPTNLSINEQAAHYTPTWNDESLAYGLIKVDFGVHVNGWVADNAFSLDLEGTEENKKLIEAAELALENVEKNIKSELTIGELGEIIENSINSYGFNSIANLSGHSMEQYNLHAGTSVTNTANNSTKKFGTGLYASEPFATNGNGCVHDGAKGNIYAFIQDKQPRSKEAREILEFIKDEFGELPFASRWVVKQFGNKSRISLMQMEREGILHHYAILTEAKGKLVSQAENTFLVSPEGVICTSK